MPVYSMRNNKTQEEFEITLKFSELENYLTENPDIKQIFTKFPGTVDPVRVGVKRVDDNFRDVLKKAKNAHKHNTVNDF